MAKERTTVNLDSDLLEAVRESGVKNVSAHIEKLMKAELRGNEKVGKREQQRVQKMVEQLDDLRDEWDEYLKREEKQTILIKVKA